ncbi:hypothetical protein BU24DRAFT_425105 [Aaosphaeria arxii CBS 175.79]|uniref:F-box domain-containing protein n=1 Tax=Aaosphaeria arxii CBS 175.79 TaxID=1450172 RepID=A0A6A5XHK1_9PLEO|nr:uncharacterized protein BU24DRAFT_425105 [Aaosphaeria arxii CBS 175.79]KAF2012443.1 hypothetical protein BU24DRAFT_425105 [Aaosphaeria arxii CBS 175.79]
MTLPDRLGTLEIAKQTSNISLDELPVELILEILSYLSPTRGFFVDENVEQARQNENELILKSLHALTVSCRRLYNVVQPILCKTFILPRNNVKAPQQLVRTFIERPISRKSLEYIEIYNMNAYASFPEGFEQEASKDVSLDDILAQVENVWQPRFHTGRMAKETWMRQLVRSYGESILTSIVLLIALAPNLLDFAIMERSISSDYPATTLALKKYHNDRSGLRNLWIKQCPSRAPALESSFQKYVFTKCVRASRLPVSGCLWLGNVHDATPSPSLFHQAYALPEIFGVEEMTLDSCELSSLELDALLKSYTNLRRFTCRWGIHDDRVRPREIDLRALNKSLSRHAESLESLVLDTLDSGWMVTMDQHIPTIGSLRHYTALTYIHVSSLVLFDDNIDAGNEEVPLCGLLPPFLEEIVIQSEWDEDLEENLLFLVEHCQEMLPHLKIVDCSWRPAHNSPNTFLLLGLFDGAGVRFKIDSSNLPPVRER